MTREGLVINTLEQKGLLTEEQIHKLEQTSLSSGKGMVETAIGMKFITEIQIRDIIAAKFSMGTVTLRDKEIPQDILELITDQIAQRYEVIPIEKKDAFLQVAISDPFRLEVIDSLSLATGLRIDPLLATNSDIQWALRKYYGYQEALGKVTVEMGGKENQQGIVYENIKELREEIEEEAPVIRLVSLVIAEAFRRRASDVHLEPLERKFRVRYRIDGILSEVETPPKHLQNSIISRIKIMANMSIDEKRLPQDGRIKLRVLGKDIDLRVSTLPGNHGESVVMRILDRESLLLGLPQLGLLSEDEKRFRQLINLPNGILLITGPTGSGKTTTLYACLNHINRPDRKIITVEDPVEYLLTGINQVQVNEDIDFTFANILRSILRQAPDVIMIGEIRDLETANIAVHASLTGHLVFSTLHTNDAASAITRLIDQRVKPFLVASSVQGIMAQRLVRKICSKCKVGYKPMPEELRAIGVSELDIADKEHQFWRGKGCDYCNGTGYRGRIAIFELLVINEEIRKLIYERVPSRDIKKRARQLGMKTLQEDGMLKVYAGVTTIDEVLRVAWQ